MSTCRPAACAIILALSIAACGEHEMNTTAIGKTETVSLGESAYRIEFASPKAQSGRWADVELRASDPYSQHVYPLYNLQEDLPSRSPRDDDWDGLWESLANDLTGKVDCFALVAYQSGKLAGMIRFFPKTITRPRYGAWSEEDHRNEWTDEILWIGGAFVDLMGTEDGLDAELIRRVVQYAREKGFYRIQALGWSEVRAYAMWGQTFPSSIYETLGFRQIATLDGRHLRALPDMLAGRHGPQVQKLVRESLEANGLTERAADEFHILELVLD